MLVYSWVISFNKHTRHISRPDRFGTSLLDFFECGTSCLSSCTCESHPQTTSISKRNPASSGQVDGPTSTACRLKIDSGNLRTRSNFLSFLSQFLTVALLRQTVKTFNWDNTSKLCYNHSVPCLYTIWYLDISYIYIYAYIFFFFYLVWFIYKYVYIYVRLSIFLTVYRNG